MLPSLTTAQQELLDWVAAYIQQHHVSPSLREMMRGMGLRSPAPVQSRLEHLRQKGYVDWSHGRARTIRLLALEVKGMPLLGTIAASGLITTFTEAAEAFEAFKQLPLNCFALRVVGRIDTLLLQAGDTLLFKPVVDRRLLKTGEIVVVQQQGETTLKTLEQDGTGLVRLQSVNIDQPDQCRFLKQLTVQGVMFGVWRSCA